MNSERRPSRLTRHGAAAALALALIATACGGTTTDTVEATDPTAVASVPTTAPVGAPDAVAPTTVPPAPTAASAPDNTEAAEAAESTTQAPEATADVAESAADAPEPTVDTPEPTVAAAAAPTASAPAPTVAAPAEAAVQLPSVDVVNLATGQTANLTTFTRSGPTLVWFWAPH